MFLRIPTKKSTKNYSDEIIHLKEKLDKQLEKKRDKIEEKLNKVLGGKAEDEKAKELIDNLKSIVK